MGCCASVESAPSEGVSSNKGSLAVIEDPELAASEHVLHQNLEKEIGVVVARRDTAVVNLQCIGSDGRLPTPYCDKDGPLAGQFSVLSAVPLPHGFAKLLSLRVSDSMQVASPRQLFAAHSMPVGMHEMRGNVMSASRAALETLITNEQRPFQSPPQPTSPEGAGGGRLAAGSGAGAGPHPSGTGVGDPSGLPAAVKPPLSQEARLKERLERLSLLEVTMRGDGNCQFRGLSYQLYGTQDHHTAVRRNVIRHIKSHKEEFSMFLGEEFTPYVEAMSRSGTWGDELTLRAACDWFGARICLITSEESNWFIQYEPRQLRSSRELFLAYISPIHYNALRRSDALRQMVRNISNRFNSLSNPSGKARQREQLEAEVGQQQQQQQLEDQALQVQQHLTEHAQASQGQGQGGGIEQPHGQEQSSHPSVAVGPTQPVLTNLDAEQQHVKHVPHEAGTGAGSEALQANVGETQQVAVAGHGLDTNSSAATASNHSGQKPQQQQQPCAAESKHSEMVPSHQTLAATP